MAREMRFLYQTLLVHPNKSGKSDISFPAYYFY